MLQGPEGGGFGARVAIVALGGSTGLIRQRPNPKTQRKRAGGNKGGVRAGHSKKRGNTGRRRTAEERRVLQALLDDVHAQFITAVTEGRKLDRARVVQFADGRIFSGAQAKALSMVDELGGLEDAVNRAAKLAGLDIPPRVIPARRRLSILDLLRNQLGLMGGRALAPVLPVFKTPLYLMD